MASLPWPGFKERDRQRERQRQERKEMLPNDDKDVTHSPPDLFHPPRQVKLEDQTSLEIKKTLGNFESVRPFMLDNSSRRFTSLIGVDQHTAGSAAQSSGTTVDPKSRQPTTTGAAGVVGSGRYNPVANKAPSHRNYPQGPGSSGSSSTTSHLFRSTPNPIPHKPPSQPQPLLSLTPHFNPGPNPASGHGASNSFSTSNSTSTHVNPLRNSNPATNYLHANSSSASSGEATAPVGEITPKVDKINNISTSHQTEKFTLRSTAPNVGVPNDKDKSTVSVTNNKPALERVDSQEVESMLREMMDVKAPLSAIQTPLKESPPKKLQRRSSKEESVVQNAANNSNSSPKSSKMDSSDSSDDSSSESTSEEDSSSGSQAGGENNDSISLKNPPPATNSPPRIWDLATIMGNLKKNDIKPADSSIASKSPKDMKQRKNLHGGNPDDVSLDSPVKTESGVTSTSLSGKLRSSSPLETPSFGLPHLAKVPGKSPRRTPDARPDPIPAKLPPINTASLKGGPSSSIKPKAQGASLSGSSSDDEATKPVKELPPRIVPKPSAPPTVVNSGRGKKRPPERDIPKCEDDSSPETKAKHRKGVQDKNKNKMIGNLFRGRHKKDKAESPVLTSKVSPSSGANVIGGTGSSVASSKQATNRVSAKDNGKKSASSSSVPTATSTPTSLVQNGELEPNSKPSTPGTATKKKQGGKASSGKDTKATPPATTHHRGGKRQKPSAPISTKTTGGTTLTPPASSVVRIKEDPPTTIKSLMCKIPLSKIPGKLFPLLPPTTAPRRSAARNSSSKQTTPQKAEKEKISRSSRSSTNPLTREESSTRVKLHYDSSRVGSSSDQTNDTHVQAPRAGPLGENSLCSDLSRVSTNNRSSYKRERRKSKSSPKKSKASAEPISHSKMDDDSIATCEVSSNVIGYTSSFEPAPVSMSRTPPVEMETLQAPDSSLNPPHLPSPVVQPQLQFYSYFEKSEHNDSDDYYTRGQEVYLEEAKRLKHKADREESGHQTQASTYLEAGLYFILAGNSMDRGGHVSREAYTMYKDTLVLIRYIASRFRNSRQDNIYETKITILSLRCQSLLALRLAKMKMKDTMDAGQYLNEHFRKTPPVDMPPMTNSMPPIANSPQLSTPSPHSPTLSPAGSSGILLGLTPSPHHPQQNHQASQTMTVSRTLYSQMYKHVTNTMNLINAHELWDGADHLVEKHHLQDFFISIDRIYGPLTLHTTLMDLVRYVRHGLGVLKNCSDLS